MFTFYYMYHSTCTEGCFRRSPLLDKKMKFSCPYGLIDELVQIFDTQHPRHGVMTPRFMGSDDMGFCFTLQEIFCTYADRCSSATHLICHLVSGLQVNILQYTKQECSNLMKFYVTTCDPITLYLSEKLNTNTTSNLPVSLNLPVNIYLPIGLSHN